MDSVLLEQLRNDFSCFVDLGKELFLDESGAKWVQNRKEIAIRFSRGEYYPNVIYMDKSYSYKEFFASEYMADLKSLAESMLVVISNEEKIFVESKAFLKNRTDTEQSGVIELIKTLSTNNLPFSKTKLLFIRGEAGLGKTSALRYLTRKTARDYLTGNSKILYFYIDAQSKSLSRLDDVVAAIIQDLQGRFHYRALATLTRLGLVVPIIDGFDELIGLGGYGEAFDSLTRFIARLNTEGTVIASARSTFYEYSGIRSKVARYENLGEIDYELDEIELLRWDDKEIINYIMRKLNIAETDAKTYFGDLNKNVLATEKDLIKVPFFLSTILEISNSKKEIDKNSRLIVQIIDHFIERESNKLRNKNGQILLPKEAHYAFLTQIAEEMWWVESTEIDVETIKLAAEIFADVYIPQREEKISFIEKSPTYAFWKNSQDDARKYVFSHEYYYSYFTAQFIYKYIKECKDTSQIFNRATIGNTIADEFGYNANIDNMNYELISLLSNRNIPYIAPEGNQENAGIMMSAIINELPIIENVNIKNVTFKSMSLSNKTFRNVQIENVKFNICNFSNTKFENVKINNCMFVKPFITPGKTDFGGIKLKIADNILGFTVSTDSGNRDVYNPSDIIKICKEINVVIEGMEEQTEIKPNDKKKYELALKFIRISQRSYYVSDDDLIKAGIRISNDWKQLEKILVDNNIIQFKHIDRKGNRSIIRKLNYSPEIILEAEMNVDTDNELSKFWKDIYA